MLLLYYFWYVFIDKYGGICYGYRNVYLRGFWNWLVGVVILCDV